MYMPYRGHSREAAQAIAPTIVEVKADIIGFVSQGEGLLDVTLGGGF